jgi:hypothetical protein
MMKMLFGQMTDDDVELPNMTDKAIRQLSAATRRQW